MSSPEASTISFRPVRREDSDNLKFWLAQPHVHRWWYQGFTDDAIESEFGDMFNGESSTHGFVVIVGDQPVGFIQYYFLGDEPSDIELISQVFPVGENDGSIDYLIGDPDYIGKGIGRQVINTFCEQIHTNHPEMDALIVAIHADNPASWKCLEHAGFNIVGYGYFTPDNPKDSEEHVILERRFRL